VLALEVELLDDGLHAADQRAGRLEDLGGGLAGALRELVNELGWIVGDLDRCGVDVELEVIEAIARCLADPRHFLGEGRRRGLVGRASIEQ